MHLLLCCAFNKISKCKNSFYEHNFSFFLCIFAAYVCVCVSGIPVPMISLYAILIIVSMRLFQFSVRDFACFDNVQSMAKTFFDF